jgi:hydroxypyruvate reductase
VSTIEFHDALDPNARAFASEMISAVLDACAPDALMDRRIGALDRDRATHVIAFGKASIAMSSWCADKLAESFAGGVALAPDTLLARKHPGIIAFGVDHPNPTEQNIQATKALIEYASAIPDDHACIVCISGGGSAHLCAPRSGVTLEQIIHTTESMNSSGASIRELNNVRRELEILKGGGLASILSRVADCRAFVLSDVLGDDLETIASGAMLHEEHPIEHTIVGSRADAGAAAQSMLGADARLHHCEDGNAEDVGKRLAESFVRSNQSLIYAGETTVDARSTAGAGGPCMHCALACAHTLRYESDSDDWIVLGLATDGIDGPTDAAGAVITRAMLDEHTSDALASCDTLAYLDRIGAAYRTGATGTNVNDIVLVTRRRLEDER